ncbi:MAG: hypothetical protein PUP92_30390 [Rhizonema sp. PD38]|nr:hypothetical protein [Rhizonema sp. PD38]
MPKYLKQILAIAIVLLLTLDFASEVQAATQRQTWVENETY